MDQDSDFVLPFLVFIILMTPFLIGLLADGQAVPVSSGAAHRRRMLTLLALLPEGR